MVNFDVDGPPINTLDSTTLPMGKSANDEIINQIISSMLFCMKKSFLLGWYKSSIEEHIFDFQFV